MECKGSQGGVIRIRQAVDDGMKRVTADDVIFIFFILVSHRFQESEGELTRSLDESSIMLFGKERVWKIAEKLF